VNIIGIITAILGLLTLVAVTASAVAIAKANLSKATIETLQASNDALSERLGIVQTMCDEQTKKLATIEAENKVLRTLGDGTRAAQEVANSVRAEVEHLRLDYRDIAATMESIAMSITASNAALLEQMRHDSEALLANLHGGEKRGTK
jgi:hypothetical protein